MYSDGFVETIFANASGTAYYPADNKTWTEDLMKKCGGDITWVPYEGEISKISAPTVTASNIASSGKIKLNWDAVDGAVKYEVYRATSKNGTYKLLITTKSTSINNTSATAGKTYYYKVRAIAENKSANSTFSSVVSRTCDLARPVVKIYTNDNGKPVIDWDKVSGATRYKVYVYNASGKLLKTANANGTKLTHSSAVAGTTYKYRVQAIAEKSAANSAKSPAQSSTSKLAAPEISIGNVKAVRLRSLGTRSRTPSSTKSTVRPARTASSS